jgi:hypothetical protein
VRTRRSRYYAWFDPAAADSATVVLITVIWMHHVIESLATRRYDPGLFTCVPYAALGSLLVSAVWRAFTAQTPVVGITEKSLA